MYRLTNLTLDTTTTYKNKDLVYQALERENARVKHQEVEDMLLVEEVDKKGIVIDQEEIFLPFDGIADSLFLKSGAPTHQEEEQSNQKRFWARSRDKNGQEPSSKKKQESREAFSDPTSDPNDSSRAKKLLKGVGKGIVGVLLVASIALAGLSAWMVTHQTNQVASLMQEVKAVKNLQTETGKLDTFVRYFLPHYYSEQADLDDFVSPKLELKHPSGQLQSVILESVDQVEDQTYQLTYVLAVKEGETRKQKRLTLTVESVSTTLYGYQVIKEPKQTNYPK